MDEETKKALNFIANDVGFGRRALGHFIEAMKRGYASTPDKGTILEMPGSKTIEYRHKEWRVLDTYLITPQGGHSGGTTVVWYGPVPVWMMQYLGCYEAAAIPCLKAALRSQYEIGKFNGGRGPECFNNGKETYFNVIKKNDFLKLTCGEEKIFDADGNKLGWHRYQAVYMVSK